MTSFPLLNGQHDHQFSPGVDATPPSMVVFSSTRRELALGKGKPLRVHGAVLHPDDRAMLLLLLCFRIHNSEK